MRKFCYLTFSLLALFLLLTACQSTENAGGNNKDAEADTTDEEVTISMWNRQSDLKNYLPEIIDSFEKEHPNIKVKLENLPVEGQEAQFQAAIQENLLPDVFTTGGGFTIPDLVEADQIADLTDLVPQDVRDQYLSGSFEAGETMMNDKVYGVPFFSPAHGAFMMYYNKDILKEFKIEKIPETWSELRETSQKIYDQSNGKTFGLIVATKAAFIIEAASEQMARTISPETGMNYKTGQYNYATEGMIETVKLYKTLLEDKTMSPSSLESGAQDVYTLFANEQAAFMFAGNYVGAQLLDRGLENFGVAKLPTKNSKEGQYLWKKAKASIAVSKYSDNLPEAKIYFEYLMDALNPYIVNSGATAPAKKLEFVEDGESRLPQFKDISDIMNTVMNVQPNPAKVNPATIFVDTRFNQLKPKERLGGIINGYLTGQITDIKGILQEFTDKNNQALEEAIKESNGKVTKEDYTFPNWVPGEDYTEEDYQ